MLEIFSVTVMSMAIYLFILFLWLNKCFMENVQQGVGEIGSVLEFSQKGLHILIVVSIFIGVLTLQSLCYFRSVKNQRRTAVLRVLGLGGIWRSLFDFMEAFVVVAASTIMGFAGAEEIFRITARKIVGEEYVFGMQGSNIAVYIMAVVVLLIMLLMVSYHISGFSDACKSMGEQLRGTERIEGGVEKEKKRRLFGFFVGIYLIILFVIAKQIGTVFVGTVILILLGLCNYVLGRTSVRMAEKFVNSYRKKQECHADPLYVIWKTGRVKSKKTMFLIAVMATGILLLYFLSSIDWGLENFLERFWVQSRQTNIYLESAYGDEQEIEKWLNENSFSYQKLYVKEWEEEGLTLAISECIEKDSPYYVQEGHMKTIAYNLYRWGVSEGDVYWLSGHEFLLDEPMKEEGFQLISYSCLIPYEDWKEQLDKSYTVAFAMCVDKKTLTIIKEWSEKADVGMMTASYYMSMVKEIYAPYLRMLEIIMLVLSFSILLFLFASILSCIIAREKEFFVYRGCGVSWQRIRNLVMVQYLYIAFVGSFVSAFLYCIIFNGFKLLWFGNSTVYFVGIRQLVMITALLFGWVGVECYIAIKFIQKRNADLTLQLRAE